MNREEFENAITALPQDFFFFEENFEKWESFKESTKNTIPYLKPDTNPIAEEDLQIAFQQMLSLTGSFKDGKTIADAIGICEKQFKATPTNDLDFDEDVLRLVVVVFYANLSDNVFKIIILIFVFFPNQKSNWSKHWKNPNELDQQL